jgi:ribonuclease G
LLYKDCDLPVRIIRDTVDGDAVITVGNKWLYEGLMNIERMRGTAKTKKINYHQSERAMYRELGISKLVSETYHSTVPLEGGGYIVIDPTEALTVVDVNTGSFVGQSCLEETVFEVNMRAAVEIARQVRLRNIAGIVVVDFIDMSKDEHRVAVVEKLKEALSADKAKTKVLPMSELGIVEFTRKRVGNDNLSLVVKPCNECKGRGYVLDDLFVITRIREDILDLFAEGYKSVIIELNEGIMQKILKE